MLNRLPIQTKFTWAPITLLIVMLVMHLLSANTDKWFGFYPSAIIQGEIWRAVTGQFLHTNTNHLLLNFGGLFLVWALHGEYYRAKHFFVIVIASASLIGAGLLLFADYAHYAGFSGILHAFFFYGAIQDIFREEKTGYLLLIGISLKVAYEVVVGPSTDTEALIGAQVAAEAHLIGVIAGGILALHLIYSKFQIKK